MGPTVNVTDVVHPRRRPPVNIWGYEAMLPTNQSPALGISISIDQSLPGFGRPPKPSTNHGTARSPPANGGTGQYMAVYMLKKDACKCFPMLPNAFPV